MTRTSAADDTQQAQFQQRLDELSALYKLSTLLAAHDDLQQVLDAAARTAVDVMKVKAASIRLLSEDRRQLNMQAVCNLSDEHLSKGPVQLDKAPLHQQALDGKMVYVEDMASDPRIIFPEDAKREGIVSVLSTGMIFQGRPVGMIRLYTAQKRVFSEFEQNLLAAIAHLMAAAITHARLDDEHRRSLIVEEQVRIASDVQRRMLPNRMPNLPGFDIAAQYVPALELGGDFNDFVGLDGHMGVAIGDVVGKGVAASLLMASVRASLRAFAQDLYDLNEVIARVNRAMVRDTLDNEFATLFYGVIDPKNKRLTYCNAGHNPPLLLRRGQVTQLDVGGLIIGVDPDADYDMAINNLEPGDLLLLYSDGMSEAKNFDNQQFGKQRIIEAMQSALSLGAASAMLKHILWQMRCFTGLQHNDDDTTTVLIHVTD